MREPRSETRLAEYLQRIREDPDFPAFSQQMREIVESLSDPEAPLQRLGRLVLRDYALSLKVLRIANSVQYRRTGQSIRSATHAMMLLGARTVTEIASTLLLFDHYHRQSSGLKELLLLSLLSAQHAREAAAQLGFGEPEAAYLCAMTFNLGEVLLAHHFPEEHAEVMRLVASPETSRDQAALKVLGFSLADLGAAVAAEWQMAGFVSEAMYGTGEASEPVLPRLARLSHELTEATYRADPGQSAASLAAVEKRFLDATSLQRDDLRAVLECGITETRALFADARVALDDLHLTQQTCAALGYLDGEDAGPRPELYAQPVAAEPPAANDPAAERAAMLEEIRAAIRAHADDLHANMLMVLEAARFLGPVDHAVFCLHDAQRTELQGRFGLGDGADDLVKLMRIRAPAADSGPLGPALACGQDVHIDGRDAAPTYRRWLQRFQAGDAVFLALRVQGMPIGALYFARRPDAPPLDAGTAAFLLGARDLAVEAVLQSRRAAPRARMAAG